MLYKLYLFGRYFESKNIKLISKLIYHFQKFLYNSSIPHSTIIGKNCQFAYGGIGVVIHSKARLGNNVMIGQGITIGGRGKGRGVPNIGNSVYIGPGARILGGVRVGNNVVIAPNAVVINHVPDNTIVGGVPAKVLRDNIDIGEYL